MASGLLAVLENKKCRPSGKNSGSRWPSVGSPPEGLVTGVGLPPAADTRKMGPEGPSAKRMVPSGPHAPPREFTTSQIVNAGPPVTATFFNLPPWKNPTKALSGDQNGYRESSNPATWCDSSESSARIHSPPPSVVKAT